MYAADQVLYRQGRNFIPDSQGVIQQILIMICQWHHCPHDKNVYVSDAATQQDGVPQVDIRHF